MVAVCSAFGEHLRSKTSIGSTVRLHRLNRKTVGADCSLLLVLQRKCSLLKVKRCLEIVWLCFSSHRDPLFTFVDSGIIVEVFFFRPYFFHFVLPQRREYPKQVLCQINVDKDSICHLKFL